MNDSFWHGCIPAVAMIAALLGFVSGCRCGNQCYVTKWREFDITEIAHYNGQTGRSAVADQDGRRADAPAAAKETN